MHPCSLLSAALTLLASTALAAASPELEILIRTPAAQMKYDRTEFVAVPGQPVKLTLQNEDEMPHNLVLCLPKKGEGDKGLEVAQVAWALGEHGTEQDWIPDDPRIFAHTRSVPPHQAETIAFLAPKTPGEYPFVCTFPGHAMVMNGLMRVEPQMERLRNLHYRAYRGPFKGFPIFGKLGDRAVGEGMLDDGLVDAQVFDGGTSYALEFEGLLVAPADGRYIFIAASDRGSELWIDDAPRVDLKVGKSWRSYKAANFLLKKGEHRLVFRYWHQGNAKPELSLIWSGPGFKEQPLSRVNLLDRRRSEEAESFVGLPLAPKENEAVIYRNFLADASPSGFGVGYPGGVNLEWNPETLNVAALWIGKFLDAKRHWTGRGGGTIAPSGYGVLKTPPGGPLAVLATEDAGWPKSSQELRFLGYRYDGQPRPTFRYRFGSVEVEDGFLPAGSLKSHDLSLTRTLRLQAKGPAPEQLYFRLLTSPFEESEGGYVVGQEVRVAVPGGQPRLRRQGAAPEVLVPVQFQKGEANVTIQYAWIGHYH